VAKVIRDLQHLDVVGFMKTVGQLSKEMEERAQAHLQCRFHQTRLQSEKQACVAYAQLMGWTQVTIELTYELLNQLKA